MRGMGTQFHGFFLQHQMEARGQSASLPRKGVCVCVCVLGGGGSSESTEQKAGWTADYVHGDGQNVCCIRQHVATGLYSLSQSRGVGRNFRWNRSR
jgi:hypothetical protein